MFIWQYITLTHLDESTTLQQIMTSTVNTGISFFFTYHIIVFSFVVEISSTDLIEFTQDSSTIVQRTNSIINSNLTGMLFNCWKKLWR